MIDNRGGAGSTIGARRSPKSAPDGYTILLGTNATLTIALSLTKNAGYERKDLASIGFVGAVPNAVVVNAKSPVRSIADLVKQAKAQGQPIQYGSPGIGTVNHLSGELLAHIAKIKMAHVPYRGAIPALSDLLGGHIELLFSAIPNVHSHIGAGTVRALAVTSAKRSQLVPDVPTVAESGFPGFEAVLGYGLLRRPARRAAVVDRLNRALRDGARRRSGDQALRHEGAEPTPTTPRAIYSRHRREETRWAAVVKDLGLVGN